MRATTKLYKETAHSMAYIELTKDSKTMEVWRYSDVTYFEVEDDDGRRITIKITANQTKRLNEFLKLHS